MERQAAYERVRDGEEVVLKARPVTIHDLEVYDVVLGADVVNVTFTVRGSSGTYVRALARDAGAALGVGGHLTSLRRTAVRLDDSLASTLDDLSEDFRLLSIADAARASSRRTTSTRSRRATYASGAHSRSPCRIWRLWPYSHRTGSSWRCMPLPVRTARVPWQCSSAESGSVSRGV